jgi:hypothetical protein
MRDDRPVSSYDPRGMRGWRSARSKARAGGAARAGAQAGANAAIFAPPVWPPVTFPPMASPPVEAPVDAPVEAVLFDPAREPAPGPSSVAPIEMQTEFLRLFEVVTSMCDHVIEYIESDRAERRAMLDMLEQLGRVITEGAAAVVGANAVRALDVTVETHEISTRERVIGGSMPAGPDPAIDLTAPEPDARPEPEAQQESVSDATSAPAPTTPISREIAVEVRGHFGDRWIGGFEICEVMTTPAGPRYRLRRHRDGALLPELFDATSIRHVETFEQLNGDGGVNGGRLNGEGDDALAAQQDASQVNLSQGYWSRS